MTPENVLNIARRAAVQRHVDRIGHLGRFLDSPAARRPANGDFGAADRAVVEIELHGRRLAREIMALVHKAGGTAHDVERVAVVAAARRPDAARWVFGM